jgi:hypothetical protein
MEMVNTLNFVICQVIATYFNLVGKATWSSTMNYTTIAARIFKSSRSTVLPLSSYEDKFSNKHMFYKGLLIKKDALLNKLFIFYRNVLYLL